MGAAMLPMAMLALGTISAVESMMGRCVTALANGMSDAPTQRKKSQHAIDLEMCQVSAITAALGSRLSSQQRKAQSMPVANGWMIITSYRRQSPPRTRGLP